MMASLTKIFYRDKKAATAVALALMTVPLIMSASAAVDFSRISSARTLMQASVDSAASAGAGAWQMSESSSTALSVTNAAYSGTSSQLPKFVTTSTPTIQLTCTGNATQCGSSASFASSTSTYGCPAGTEYCVIVSEHGTLHNSLFSWIIPSEALTVKSVATTEFPALTITNNSFTDTSIGVGSDLSGIYAYAVPEDAGGKPQYGNVPAPNTNCEGESRNGPLGDEPASTYVAPGTDASGNPITNCNFLLIGESTGGSFSGSLTFAASDPIAFSFVNFTGKTLTSGEPDTTTMNSSTYATTINSGNTQYTSELYANGIYQSAGETIPAVPAVAYVPCSGHPCTGGSSGTSGAPAMQLYGYCPAHNLYGSLVVYPDYADNIVPAQDSLQTYSSAYEVLGYPPTHGINHALTPFLGPVVTLTTASQTITAPNGRTSTQPGVSYNVQAVCPQWPLTNTGISAQTTMNFTPTGYSADTTPRTVNVYSTYFPDGAFSSGLYAPNIYPPAISGCTPVTSPISLTVLANASTADPWWGWSPDNATAYDPSSWWPANTQNCTFVHITAGGTRTITPYSATTGQNAPFTSPYNNCALLIQDLGNDVTTLPNYWTYKTSPTLFAAGGTGNPAGIFSMTAATGSAPTGNPTITSAGSGTFNGVAYSSSYNVSEPPTEGTATAPPEDTSHQCYNPQANGITAGTYVGDNNNGTAIDPVENPQLGVINCADHPLESYALFWNDMGAWADPSRYNDDLGYQNAVTNFTCPAQGTTSGGGPVTLSG